VAPATPTDLAGSAGSHQALLTWNANTEIDLAGYSIFRRLVGDADFTEIATRVVGTTYTDLGLQNNVIYEYQIIALDRADNPSAATERLELMPLAGMAPSAPSGLTRKGRNFLRPTFVFTNAIPVQPGATLTYTVQVSTKADFSNVTDSESGIAEGAGVVGVEQTTWTITRNLSEGTSYFWRVRAVEGDLIGPFSQAEEFVAEGLVIMTVVLLPDDFNDDKIVDIDDFFLFGRNFGKPATGDTGPLPRCWTRTPRSACRPAAATDSRPAASPCGYGPMGWRT